MLLFSYPAFLWTVNCITGPYFVQVLPNLRGSNVSGELFRHRGVIAAFRDFEDIDIAVMAEFMLKLLCLTSKRLP